MARKKRNGSAPLEGADEFIGADPDQEAIEKIEAAKAAAKEGEADTKAGDNGGPPLDQDAWSSACDQYVAEMLTIEELEKQKAAVRGRISSIRKVAKKRKVDWDLVVRYYREHKDIRLGGMGRLVTEERRYRWLLKVKNSPLATQFDLWQFAEEANGEPAAASNMEPELAGQHAYAEGASLVDNPYHAATDVERHNEWRHGWVQAQNAKARSMGPIDQVAGSQ